MPKTKRTDLKTMAHRITLPILDSILHCTLEDDTYLDKKSFALLLDIQNTLSVFEPIDDDEARKIWLEIPRGTAEGWKAFDDERSWYHNPEEDNLASYQEALASEFPYEKEWFFLVTSTYRENTFLKISDRDHRYVILTNRHFHDNSEPTDMCWFLEPLLQQVKERVADIVKDPDAYNQYIEENLPYRQRSGVIKSKDLNRIIPKRKLKVYESGNTDWEGQNVPAPFETMSIRQFCKYYRIADTAWLSKPGKKRAQKVSDDRDDVECYRYRNSLHGPLDQFDLDSEKDYLEFAQDHYGELGLSRMNVGATRHYAGGKWLITFGSSINRLQPFTSASAIDFQPLSADGMTPLGAALRAAVDLRKQRQLPLRGQGCLGLIEKIEAAGSKRVLRERKKALPVGFFVVMLGDAPGSAAVLIFHGGDIIEALRAQEIPVDGLSDTAREADGAAQLRVRVVC